MNNSNKVGLESRGGDGGGVNILACHSRMIRILFVMSNLPFPFPPDRQLYNMETRPKSDPAFEALGNMDELNASLALAAEHSALADNGLYEIIVTIQSLIIDASALVATPRDSSSARKISRTGFPMWCTEQLEVQ